MCVGTSHGLKGYSAPCYALQTLECREAYMNPCIPTGTKVFWPIESTLGSGVDGWRIYTGPLFEEVAPNFFTCILPNRLHSGARLSWWDKGQ